MSESQRIMQLETEIERLRAADRIEQIAWDKLVAERDELFSANGELSIELMKQRAEIERLRAEIERLQTGWLRWRADNDHYANTPDSEEDWT